MIKKIFLSLFLTTFTFAQSVGDDNNKFAFALVSQLEEKSENLAFSPYGIFSNLALLYFGADGDTATQIKSVLHLSASDDLFLKAFHKHFHSLSHLSEWGYQLEIANALFSHKGTHFLKKYQEIATDYFDAKIQSIDYELPDSVLRIVNGWISEKTRGRIPELIHPEDIDASTRLMAINTVFFQGDWQYPFSPQMTALSPFYLESSSSAIDVEMVHQLHSFPYFENEEIQCVALPFARKDVHQPFLECIVILPKQRSLDHLETNLNAENFAQWNQSLKPTYLDVKIPKFCFSKRLQLNTPLENLGMKDSFSYLANFSNINGMKDLHLQKVLHETYVSFHEKGLIAAAATSSQIGMKALPPSSQPPTLFVADHPFFFFIVDYHSQSILFMGRVTDPTKDVCR